MSRECPNSTNNDKPNKGNNTCFNCGESGHMSKECTKPRKQRNKVCFNCGEEGHTSRECTNPSKQLCRNCHKEGHKSYECPEKDQTQGRRRETKSSWNTNGNDNNNTGNYENKQHHQSRWDFKSDSNKTFFNNKGWANEGKNKEEGEELGEITEEHKQNDNVSSGWGNNNTNTNTNEASGWGSSNNENNSNNNNNNDNGWGTIDNNEQSNNNDGWG
jgi:cellular nucleic acid-binding protein